VGRRSLLEPTMDGTHEVLPGSTRTYQ
jgi:hypothetical protein